jgi:D-sedoheptulose 7-phosphate isomerase
MTSKQHFEEALAVLQEFLANPDSIQSVDKAIRLLAECLRRGGKIIACGNGGSMCDAMHFAEELSGRYRKDRPALAAISISDPSHITCVANDYGFEQVFSRFVEAHGKEGDVLLAISTSGNSENVFRALKVALSKGMFVVGLTGKDGGKIGPLCDVELRAPSTPFADRAQELHIKIIHSLIEGIERELGYVEK